MGKNYLGGQFMKKKLFFAGMLALVFGLILTGCPTDSDDDDGGNNSGGGGGGNALVGTWVDNQDFANLGSAMVFTNTNATAAGVATGTKLAYYVTGLNLDGDQGTNGNDTVIPIGNNQTGYVVSNSSADQFTLQAYGPDDPSTPNINDPVDVVFKRAPGTSKYGNGAFQGIWISELANTEAKYTILLIGGANGKKVWSAVGANATRTPNYLTAVDPATSNTVISWNGGNSVQYTIATVANTKTLDIPPPAGGNAITLKPLYDSPSF
jgi:hypothetical protein